MAALGIAAVRLIVAFVPVIVSAAALATGAVESDVAATALWAEVAFFLAASVAFVALRHAGAFARAGGERTGRDPLGKLVFAAVAGLGVVWLTYAVLVHGVLGMPEEGEGPTLAPLRHTLETGWWLLPFSAGGAIGEVWRRRTQSALRWMPTIAAQIGYVIAFLAVGYFATYAADSAVAGVWALLAVASGAVAYRALAAETMGRNIDAAMPQAYDRMRTLGDVRDPNWRPPEWVYAPPTREQRRGILVSRMVMLTLAVALAGTSAYAGQQHGVWSQLDCVAQAGPDCPAWRPGAPWTEFVMLGLAVLLLLMAVQAGKPAKRPPTVRESRP